MKTKCSALRCGWKRHLKWERSDEWMDENVKHVVYPKLGRFSWCSLFWSFKLMPWSILGSLQELGLAFYKSAIQFVNQLLARKNGVTNSFETNRMRLPGMTDNTKMQSFYKQFIFLQAIHLLMTLIRGWKRKQLDWCLQQYQNFFHGIKTLRTLTWLILKRKHWEERNMHSNISEKSEIPCVRTEN